MKRTKTRPSSVARRASSMPTRSGPRQARASFSHAAPHLEYYQLIVDHLHEGVVVQTREGLVIACNPSAQRILRQAKSLIGRNIYSVMTPFYREDGSTMAEPERPINRVLETGIAILNERVGLKLMNGEVVWINESIVPVVREGRKTPDTIVVSFTDIGPVREAQRRLQHLATRDSLTGLYNRAYLVDQMRELFPPSVPAPTGETPSDDSTTALLFIDLDGFKKVNDSAGHETGDALLREVALRLTRSAREHDVIARVGGDEFVIVLRGFSNAHQVAAFCRRIIRVISEPFNVDDGQFFLGASIGICLYPRDGNDGVTLMRNADSAMFQAKIEGRNTYRFFTSELTTRLERRICLEQGLRNAIKNASLRLVYQPIVSSADGRIVAVEALLRWTDRELGDISPVEFVPIAEEASLIGAIGQWVLLKACESVAQWRQTLSPNLAVSVNLSPRQVNDALVTYVQQCLDVTGLDGSALELEITEGALLAGSKDVLTTLTRLTEMGVSIAIDDFGTGYSSLSYLKRFPVKSLKVDRSFVFELPDDRDSAELTRAIIVMARSLGLGVTAEGVETVAQADFLRSLQCARLQGYLFGKPLSEDDMTRALIEAEGTPVD
ncbi:putative bifunctional diguanylate cyclase/phosphodiesterase [Pararobbsia silviterrae]|uniref:EAL domain-containing protein n=1 Tax=Pararobbsia silviterrae TaxID=1792498 RepID=A0A494XIY5_9BURK|nr:EAL domain-containing protein [Pararobbsia silviterrae]RKP49681.1 EAL domain-containing protein [Pararobbsia silviterrae]